MTDAKTDAKADAKVATVVDPLYADMLLKPDDIDMVIYHGMHCPDGFASALAAYKYFKEKGTLATKKFFPGKFDEPAPDVKGLGVGMFDFSYKRAIVDEMIKQAKVFGIGDHHYSAMKDLEGLDKRYKTFDMKHSGAYLAWKFFFPTRPVPKFILYIEDNDIWAKKLPNTNEFSSWLTVLPQEFEVWEKYLDDKYFEDSHFEVEGAIMMKLDNYNVDARIKKAAPKFMEVEHKDKSKKYYFVAHINSATLQSQMGNRVFTEFPNADFSCIWKVNDWTNQTQMALRSMDDRADVSELAQLFGGGGHKCASGLQVNMTTTTFPGVLIDNYKAYSAIGNIYFGKCNGFDVVYLNTTHHKSKLAKYLLQTRCKVAVKDAKDKEVTNGVAGAAAKDKPIEWVDVQECASIVQNRTKAPCTISCKMAAVWNYDGNTNKTWFTVFFHPSVDKKIKDGFKWEYKANDTYVVSVDGFKNTLPELTELVEA